ncbi:NB-ARC and TPR domain protein [Colletotrichum tofieldiae]|nr:NB-ARC and TPR domain protein [Colletotrichum tofieldiae]
MYERALQGYEKALGPDHASTISTVNNLGLLCKSQGRLKELRRCTTELFRLREGIGTTSHVNTRHNQQSGILYSDQGRLKEAEAMYDRALHGKEKALGPYHTSTLSTVNNLGLLYNIQVRLKEAEEMYERALQGYEKALGPDHASALSTVNNLGFLYYRQGRFKEAEAMYDRALQGKEKALDQITRQHSTQSTIWVFSTPTRADSRRPRRCTRGSSRQEKALGPYHTSTLSTVNNLGNLYADQGRLKEAEAMYQRLFTAKRRHWDQTTLNNLGLLYSIQGRLKEAEEMYERALQGYEKALGPDHTSTLDTVNNLGLLYSRLGTTTSTPLWTKQSATSLWMYL